MRIIKEFTEFSLQRMGSGGDGVQQASHVNNPNLSMGSYDKFDSNMKNSMNKLNDIYKNISKSTTGVNLRTGNIIDATSITKLTIIRIFPKDDIFYNVYFSFEFDEEEYYGVIEKINSPNPNIRSEIFRDKFVYGETEWVIRIKGNILKAIKQWMKPPTGNYTSLKEIDMFNEKTGEMILLDMNKIIEVIRVLENDSIMIKYNDRIYNIRGLNYYYFNYYFLPMSEK